MKLLGKKGICMVIAICVMLSMAIPAVFAEDKQTYIDAKLKGAVVLSVGSPNAMIGSQKVQIDPANRFVVPVVENDATLVPVRFVSEALGAKVGWDEQTQTVSLSLGGSQLAFVIGEAKMLKDGKQTDLLAAPKMENSRTLVPLRAIAEGFGKQVFYDRGLIIISDTKDIFDPQKEPDVLDQIIMDKLGSLPSVDSYANYVAIVSGLGQSSRTGSGGVAVFEDGAVSGAGSGANAPAPEKSANASMDSAANGKGSSGTSDAGYSSTNVQVEGVDEADVIKTDGSYIYKVRQNKISIVKAVPADAMLLVSEINFEAGNYYPQEMYVDGDRLVVIGSYWKDIKYENGPQPAADTKMIMPYPYYSKSFVRADVYDISDKTRPVSMRQVELEGNYVSSRKIGSSLYFVTNYYTYNYNPDPSAPPGEVRPMLRDTAAGADFTSLDFKSICYLPGFSQLVYLNIAGFDIANDSRKAEVVSYLGGGNSIYVSAENMYVAVQTYEAAKTNGTDNGDTKPAVIEPWDYAKPITKVFKFAIKDTQINYVATGQAEGNILNQFSMDEYNGDFRIATTSWNGNTQYNNLFVLDSAMQLKGKIDNLAPGERIYSTRFMGDKAYMVTFKQVDPLFVIDLADPAKPQILGQLKIPGYSDYLHPYDATHIIGFGKDADENGRAKGMKMAIFDVSDFANPRQMYAEAIGDRGTYSPLLYDHKALLFSKEKNLLAFPVSLYEIDEAQKDNKDAYGMFKYQGLYVYGISLENGFTLRGRLSHISDEELKKFGNVAEGSSAIVERGLYIGNSLYTVSNFGIMSNDLDTLNQRGFVTY